MQPQPSLEPVFPPPRLTACSRDPMVSRLGSIAMSSVTPLTDPALRLNAPSSAIKIELDERCFLFPDGKIVSHILLTSVPNRVIAVDAVFTFN